MSFTPDQNSASRYLTEFQRKLLEKRLTQKDLPKLHRKRIEIMLLANAGKSQTEICRTLGCCPATVRHWILTAKSGQAHTWLDSLPGRPKVIHQDYIDRLKELVEQSPRDCGYAFRRWTAGWLAKQLEKEFEIRISDRHINRLLKQMGLSTRSQSLQKPHRPPAESLSKHTAYQGSDVETPSSGITIYDLQSASSPEPVTPIDPRGQQTDLNPLNQGSNIYGAESVSPLPFCQDTQPSFWHTYFRYSLAEVS